MINVINKLKQSDLPSLEEGGELSLFLELNALVPVVGAMPAR